jgi:hypothetical protein
MGKIHYATGGLITPEKSEFSTLCGRKFPQGHSVIMQSGYSGAKNVTCVDCRAKIDWHEQSQKFFEDLEKLIRKARGNDEIAKRLMYAISKMPII